MQKSAKSNKVKMTEKREQVQSALQSMRVECTIVNDGQMTTKVSSKGKVDGEKVPDYKTAKQKRRLFGNVCFVRSLDVTKQKSECN
jgi:hypothetical protein